MPERFTPDPRAARAERLAGAGGAAVLVALALWLLGATRQPALLATAALAGGAAVHALTGWRARREGLRWVEVGSDGLTLGRPDGERTIAWTDVTRAVRAPYGGGWVLTTTARPRHLVLRLDGLSSTDAARLATLLRERVPRG